MPITKPRAIYVSGGELVLDAYQVFMNQDLLSELCLERMLAGVATRRHVLVEEPIGTELEKACRGNSKSAISRRFVQATTKKVDELLHRDLSQLDVGVLMIDGMIFKGCCVVVALVICADGTKGAGRPVGRRHREHRGRA